MNITIGEQYRLRHCRFGTATVKILAVNGIWIDVEIIAGLLHGASRGMRWGPGETKTVRDEHCTFTPHPRES